MRSCRVTFSLIERILRALCRPSSIPRMIMLVAMLCLRVQRIIAEAIRPCIGIMAVRIAESACRMGIAMMIGYGGIAPLLRSAYRACPAAHHASRGAVARSVSPALPVTPFVICHSVASAFGRRRLNAYDDYNIQQCNQFVKGYFKNILACKNWQLLSV